MEAAYALLLTLDPFRSYAGRVPAADQVRFEVMATTEYQGLWFREAEEHVLRVSGSRVSTVDRLVRVLAHELIHLIVDHVLGGERAEHGTKFRRLAARACRHHRWDEKEFWP